MKRSSPSENGFFLCAVSMWPSTYSSVVPLKMILVSSNDFLTFTGAAHRCNDCNNDLPLWIGTSGAPHRLSGRGTELYREEGNAVADDVSKTDNEDRLPPIAVVCSRKRIDSAPKGVLAVNAAWDSVEHEFILLF
ncbi:hypothetical protein EDC04DRAFT_2613648 [Pisolithus marmoratus]|nr:hypothetical protein EDC04DRAFT_2613648 [Pisolithus marmoratus]